MLVCCNTRAGRLNISLPPFLCRNRHVDRLWVSRAAHSRLSASDARIHAGKNKARTVTHAMFTADAQVRALPLQRIVPS